MIGDRGVSLVSVMFGPPAHGLGIFKMKDIVIRECLRIEEAWRQVTDGPLLLADVMGELL